MMKSPAILKRLIPKRGWAVLAVGLVVLSGGAAGAAEAAGTAAETPPPAPAKAPIKSDPLAFLDPFIGVWLPHPDWTPLREGDPQLRSLIPLNLQWGTRRASIGVEEGLRRDGGLAISGTLAWNPVSGRAEFLAVQSDDRLLFQGHYEPVDSRTVRRIYDVIGPSGDTRVYRETFRLRPDGVLDWTTEHQVDGVFRSVAGVDGPEFQAVRPAAGMPAWARRHLESQVGRWTADNSAYRSDQEPYDFYRIVWEWGPGEQSLLGRLVGVEKGRESAVFWEYRVAWQPADHALRVTQYGRDGSTAEGVLRPTGEHSSRLQQTLYAPDGSSTQIGHRERLEWGVRFVESFDVEADGTWKPRRSYRFLAENVPDGPAP